MTARADIAARAAELRRARLPFVHARVVLAERPTSAKAGDEALVLPDGSIEGFVGGACAESTVRSQALALLDSGETMLVRITPDPEGGQPGKQVVHNPCLSGGTLEIFLEPVVPAPRLVVVGHAPVAQALVGLGERMGWEVDAWSGGSGATPIDDDPIADDPIADATAVVVASHGHDEEPALLAALRAAVPYVGLVASRKRGEAVVASLDCCGSMKARVRTPAGLDIGARTPEEIALSILAELVSLRPRPTGRPVTGDESPAGTAVDPVCGMSVTTVEASLHLDHDGERFWFCGSGCLRAFAADPAGYRSS